MVLGGGAFEARLRHEGGSLMNGTSALIKEIAWNFLAPPTI